MNWLDFVDKHFWACWWFVIIIVALIASFFHR